VGIGRPAVIPASTPPVTRFEAPQAGYPAAGSKTGRYRAIEIQAGNHTITATDPLPDDLRTADPAITQCAR
jgi:hypothetical protein